MKWYSITDILPDYEATVLLVRRNAEIIIGYRHSTDRDGEHYHGPYNEVTEITHWAPLPDLPTIEEDE
jgi:hypothetical protein